VTLQSGRSMPVLQRNVLPLSLGAFLKPETTCPSEVMVHFYKQQPITTQKIAFL